jgi:Zn-finger nucleic acid-binding protein
LLLAIAVSVRPVAAQESNPASAPAVTANEIKDVADELWCPLCSGVRLDACELRACDQMKRRDRRQAGSGESTKDEIKDYFVRNMAPRYGRTAAGRLQLAGVAAAGRGVCRRRRLPLVAHAQHGARPKPAAESAATMRTGRPRIRIACKKELKQYD